MRCPKAAGEPASFPQALFLGLALLVSLSVAAGESPSSGDPAALGGQSLEQAASDPTASLLSVQVQNLYSGDYHNLNNESSNSVQLRSAIPFRAFGIDNIARATLPVVTDSPNGSGVADLTLFNLAVFKESWGRWGVGPVILVPIGADDLTADQWAAGPAVGFTASQPGLLWGLFNQNVFSFSGGDKQDVNLSILQPIFNYSLPDKWSIGTSEMNLVYDWEQDDWTALPLGMKLAKLIKFGALPVQFAGSYEYNFADDYITPEWTFTLTAKFLFPI
jgi:hypothetical protein